MAFQIFIVGNKTMVLKTIKFCVYFYYSGRFYDRQGYCRDHPKSSYRCIKSALNLRCSVFPNTFDDLSE